MKSEENPVHYQLPVLEHAFTPSQIQELFSLLQSLPSTIRPTSSSGSPRSVLSAEERKRRRMLSNRLSARRSRFRKKWHLDNLTNEINRLRLENRELKNRLCVLSHDCYVVQRDSNMLLSESLYLQQRLAGLNQILSSTAMQLQ